jgi:four helix bundle protein
MEDFKELKVWTRAHEMTMGVYHHTRYTRSRRKSCTVSPANFDAQPHRSARIAEGCGRRSDGEFSRFLHIARGSARELEYHLLLARDLHLLPEDGFRKLDG